MHADKSQTPQSSLLFSPFQLRDVIFPNRVVISPMQMYKAGPEGLFTDWHFQHLAKYAVGGAGTVMTEALIVDPIGRNTYGDCGIWSDDHIAPLRRIASFLRENGAVAAAQLHHAGPKAARKRPWEGLGPLGAAEADRGEPAWQPVGASAGRTVVGWHEQRPVDRGDIGRIVDAYARATRRIDRAGFEVLDIHAAHGYLIHSFLSPVSNIREDAYGGDIHGRMRLALEIAECVRANWPKEKALFFRISCVDWRADLDDRTDGWRIEDSFILAKELHLRGVDLIDCSSGGIRSENSVIDYARKGKKLARGFQVPHAEAIRRETEIPTMAVGVILDGPQAESILKRNQADLVAIGREALNDPNWALHAAQALGVDPDWQQWPASYGWWLGQRQKIGIGPSEQSVTVGQSKVGR